MSPIVKHVVLSSLTLAAVCVALGCAITPADSTQIAAALTNLGAIGGIASGLSFAALSIFTLKGSYQEKVLKNTGSTARGLVFYTLLTIMAASLISGIIVIWSESAWVKVALPVLLFFIAESFYITFRITYTAYEWEAKPLPKNIIDAKYTQD